MISIHDFGLGKIGREKEQQNEGEKLLSDEEYQSPETYCGVNALTNSIPCRYLSRQL